MCSENQDLRQMSSKLLSVEPHRLSDLSSFEKLQEVVGDWSTDRWQEFWGDQLRPTRSSDPKWANVLESWAALSLQEKDHATASLALAVMLGIAAVFVANPAGKVGFGIKADYWFLMNLQPKGIEGVIGQGIWQVPTDLGLPARLALDHMGYPLYTNGKTLGEFGRRPINSAVVRAAANAVVGAFVRDYPGWRMKKDDFIAAVRGLDDRISISMARSFWPECAPADWQRAGTKAGSPRAAKPAPN